MMNKRRVCEQMFEGIPAFTEPRTVDELQSGKKLPFLARFESKFAVLDKPNGNKRIYREALYRKYMTTDEYKTRLEAGLINGQIKHPEGEPDPTKISHIFDELYIKRDDATGLMYLWCKGRIADTLYGRVMFGLRQSGVNLGLSQRSICDSEVVDGNEEMGKNYYFLEGGDFVSVPAVADAFPVYSKDSLKIACDSVKKIAPSLTDEQIVAIVEELEEKGSAAAVDQKAKDDIGLAAEFNPGERVSWIDAATGQSFEGIVQSSEGAKLIVKGPGDAVTQLNPRQTQVTKVDGQKAAYLSVVRDLIEGNRKLLADNTDLTTTLEAVNTHYKGKMITKANETLLLKTSLKKAQEASGRVEVKEVIKVVADEEILSKNTRLQESVISQSATILKLKKAVDELTAAKAETLTRVNEQVAKLQKQIGHANDLLKQRDILHGVEIHKLQMLLELPVSKREEAKRLFASLRDNDSVDEVVQKLSKVIDHAPPREAQSGVSGDEDGGVKDIMRATMGGRKQ